MKYEYILSSISVLIGICVSAVAYQQYRLGKDRFRLDLFEKRFAVYKGVQIFLTHVLSDGKASLDKPFEFRASTQDAVFLFQAEVPAFIEKIDETACKMMAITERIEDVPPGEERSCAVKQKSELFKWLVDQLSELKGVFGPYLRFKAWK
jgi:hypothetical protein